MTRHRHIVALLVTTLGCYSHFDVPLGSVRRLDGFVDGQHRELETSTGEHIVFDRDTLLSFHDELGEPVVVDTPDEGPKIDRERDRQERFTAISIEGPLFIGTTRSLERFVADLRATRSIRAKKPAPLMTTLAIVIPSVVLTALVVALFFPVCQATRCFGSFWSEY